MQSLIRKLLVNQGQRVGRGNAQPPSFSVGKGQAQHPTKDYTRKISSNSEGNSDSEASEGILGLVC